jgi:hypothetical protein
MRALMARPRLVYLASGRDEFITQALYSAWSALAWKGSLPLSIAVYTDRPEAFAGLGPDVEPILLDAAQARDWRGPWDFVYRMKAKVVEDVARRHPGDPLLLIDADTFWVGGLGQVFDRIGERSAVMHKTEYFVGTHETMQMRKFRRRMARLRFRGAPIDVQVWMWNSGAIGLHPAHFPLVAEWIDFMDEVHPRNRKPLVEQFYIGSLLQRRLDRVSPCDDLLFHYWNDKDRHMAAIAGVLSRLPTMPREEALAWLRERPVRIEGAPQNRKATFFQRIRTSIRERLPLRRTHHG